MLKKLWIPDFQAYSSTVLALCHASWCQHLIWPLACVHTLDSVACLERVLITGHVCCAEIRNHIDSMEKW